MSEASEAGSPAHLEYQARLELRRRAAERWRTHDRRFSNARLAVFAVGVVQGFLTFGTHALTAPWLIPTVVVFVALLVFHDRVIQARRGAERSVAFYERGLARLEDRWAGSGTQRWTPSNRSRPPRSQP